MIQVVQVGRIKKVNLRDVWKHEAKDFTPWLLENPDVLGDALNLEVEFSQSEQQVGPYAVDIIGKDLTHDSVLIVENQLEKTNHTHLGQLITYAANTDAVTVVWIAKEFTDEHRQAIDYLNELSGDSGKARFFAVQVVAIQIDNSSPAPLLELVAQPNELHASMSSAVRDAVEPSGRSSLYRELWRKYFELVKIKAPDLTKYSSPSRVNWQNVNEAKGGWGSIVLLIDKEKTPRAEFYIRRRDEKKNFELYQYLKDQKTQIEKEFGCSLVWDEQEHLVSRRIMSKRVKPIDITSLEEVEELLEWFLAEHKKFKEYIFPRVYDFVDSRE